MEHIFLHWISSNVSIPNSQIISLLTTCSNLVYIGIFGTVELAFGLVAAKYFALADGKPETADALSKAGGAFAFASGMLGYYTVAHLMCQSATFFSFPMGDTSRFFVKKSERRAKDE